MHLRTLSVAALTLLATLAVSAPSMRYEPADDLSALEGRWLYVEDLTEGRAIEDQQPPMSVTFGLRIDETAAVMLRGAGSRQREEPFPLDGSTLEADEGSSMRIVRGEWKDGTLSFDLRVVRKSDDALVVRILREFRITPDGLQIRVVSGDPPSGDQLALYRHPEDIQLPTPVTATIADMEWLAGAWTGARTKSSIEEHWTPPKGGAMLGVSRTVSNSSKRMSSFEFLRIVERGGGLVYIAQPGGSSPTEFILVDVDKGFASFENPRHDSPQRIAYELTDDGLTASIGFINGGRPTTFEFTREED